MKLIIGLGNPGNEYAATRHNIGFQVIDEICRRLNSSAMANKFSAEITSVQIGQEKYFFAKPQTFMNNSGLSVRAISDYYKISLTDICIIHDDIDLPVGEARIKRGGGNGGHNGLRSIDQHCGVDYLRIRIGVGHPGERAQVSNYVLHNFAANDLSKITPLVIKIAANFEKIFVLSAAEFTTLLRAS